MSFGETKSFSVKMQLPWSDLKTLGVIPPSTKSTRPWSFYLRLSPSSAILPLPMNEGESAELTFNVSVDLDYITLSWVNVAVVTPRSGVTDGSESPEEVSSTEMSKDASGATPNSPSVTSPGGSSATRRQAFSRYLESLPPRERERVKRDMFGSNYGRRGPLE